MHDLFKKIITDKLERLDKEVFNRDILNNNIKPLFRSLSSDGSKLGYAYETKETIITFISERGSNYLEIHLIDTPYKAFMHIADFTGNKGSDTD